MILFIPSNRYHVQTFASVVRHLDLPYIFADVSRVKNEGATETAIELGLPLVPAARMAIVRTRPTVVVTMNDWGAFERRVVTDAKKLGVLTLGLVEGAQDYEDTHVEDLGFGGKRYPYQTVDVPLLMGEFDRNYLKSPSAIITGCPRMDALFADRTPLPEPPKILINSNFTYRLYEDVRDMWVNDVVSACNELEIDYMITRHPQDRGDFLKYNKTDLPLYEAIRQTNVLISRFSTAILEAMALGRQVVYYNPHSEYQPTFRDPMGAFPIAENKDQLIRAIQDVIDTPNQFADARKVFMENHLGPLDSDASFRAADAIRKLSINRPRMTFIKCIYGVYLSFK